MLSFRKKILLSDLVLFLIFLALLFSFVERLGILYLGAFILLLYSVMTWAIIHRLSRPIQQIIDAISPYQEGREEFLPRIVLQESGEFGKLAFTLNSLTGRIQKQIENLKQQRTETEGILESLNEGVIALDTEAKVTFSNLVACKMLRVSREEIIGRSLDQVGSDELILECNGLVLKALQSGESALKTWIYSNHGRTILDLVATPLMQQNGAILVLQDKTSDHKIVQMGKDFIANASHELRTPITIIRGFAEMLPELREEMQREVTEKIVRTCGRLEKLVKSLLTLSDMENLSEETFRSCDLVALAETCKHHLLAAHPEASISIDSKEKFSILADPDLLELALMNLLENAVRYSQGLARVEVSVRRIQDRVFLNVADEGIGIPEADLPYIFDRFYTVDKARSRKSGGAGLGLSIVKTIVEKHKGESKVSSRLGKGSVFSLVFPSKQEKNYKTGSVALTRN